MWDNDFNHPEVKSKKFQRLVKTEGKFEYTLKWKSYETKEYSCEHVFNAYLQDEGIDNFIYDNGEIVHTDSEKVDMSKFFEVDIKDYGFYYGFCVCPECYLRQAHKMLKVSETRFLFHKTEKDTFKEIITEFIDVKDKYEIMCTNDLGFDQIVLVVTGHVRLAYIAEAPVYYQEEDGCYHAEWELYNGHGIFEDEDDNEIVGTFDAEDLLLQDRFYEAGACQYFVSNYEIKGIWMKDEYRESLSKGEQMILFGFCRNNNLKIYDEDFNEVEL